MSQPTLTPAQRWALALAEAHGWGVAVEAVDGTRVTLRHGRPAYGLVLFLGDAARVAAQQAVTAAATAQATATQRAAGDAQRAEARAQLLAAAPGLTGPALESAVDQALTQQALANMDRVLNEKRRQYGL